MSILDHVAIRVRCGACSGEYSVPASVVLQGQQAIAPGCPGCSDYECEARFVATLADQQALSALEAAWAAFEASVASHGGLGAMLVAVPAVASPTHAEAAERIRRTRAVQRWESEGGRCLDRRASHPA